MICPNCGEQAYKIWGNGPDTRCDICGESKIGTEVTPDWLKESRKKLGDQYEIIPPTPDGKVGGVFDKNGTN